MGSTIKFLRETIEKYSPVILFFAALFDTSIFALPVTTIFVLQVFVKGVDIRKSIISVLTGTVIGSLIGYFLGHIVFLRGDEFMSGMVQPIMDKNHGFSLGMFYKIKTLLQTWGAWVIMAGTFTPIPYGMFSITSGVFDLNVFMFLIVTIISHGLKYSIIAFLANRSGYRILRIIFFLPKEPTKIISGQ